ncbi:MAG TPA: methionyl-tRNA formyltransferase [Microbacteriaceae bacterium]|jgi:methionyl-tRNA formyltransferase|nr:methionyl-tRNA formyltransferase [Microbacteriaceae bacterium]
MRLVFAGTPSVAVPSLARLTDGEHEIAAVITRRDAELGRKRVLTPSPVAAFAVTSGLPTIRANRLDEDATARIAALAPDLGVIVAYGGLVREPLLSTPRLGWINLHFSLLPRWRGAAPVQRAIIAGDAETGAAVFQLVAELDAGDVFGELTRPIGADETAADVLGALAGSGAELLASVVDRLAAGDATAVPQRGTVTLAPKLTLEDARIDFSAPAETAYNRLRGVTPEPGAFTVVGDARLKLHEAALASDAAPLEPGRLALDGARVLVGTATHPLELVTVQPAGKRAMPAADWWRGLPTTNGLVVG